jgi:hypothetical protein
MYMTIKKNFYLVGVIVAIAATSWNFSQNRNGALSDVALDKVEALGSEIGDACGGCSTNCYFQFCCLILIDGTGFALNRCS